MRNLWSRVSAGIEECHQSPCISMHMGHVSNIETISRKCCAICSSEKTKPCLGFHEAQSHTQFEERMHMGMAPRRQLSFSTVFFISEPAADGWTGTGLCSAPLWVRAAVRVPERQCPEDQTPNSFRRWRSYPWDVHGRAFYSVHLGCVLQRAALAPCQKQKPYIMLQLLKNQNVSCLHLHMSNSILKLCLLHTRAAP